MHNNDSDLRSSGRSLGRNLRLALHGLQRLRGYDGRDYPMSRNPGYHPTPGVGTYGINKGCD